MENIVIKVRGMNCASCATSVQHRLLGEKGIEKVDINFTSSEVSIEFDNEVINSETIKNLNLGHFQIVR